MGIRRAGGARAASLTLLALLGMPGAVFAAALPANPFEELAEIEEQRLEAAGGGAEAIGPLLGLMGLAEVIAPQKIDPAIRRLVFPPGGGHPNVLVSARARDYLARRAEEAGDGTRAAELRRPLGGLSKFWVVGPFGDGRAAIDVTFPPEEDAQAGSGAPDPGRRFPGKERDVSWRRAEGVMRRGALELGALLRPDSQAAAYLQTFVHVERATDAALRLGTPGPVKVWCNGARVYAADRVRSARFDQDAVGVRLRAGWNRLLIKTVVTEGTWRVFARLTAPDGSALSFADDWAPAPSAVWPGAGRGEAPPAVRVASLEALLRTRLQSARGGPGGAQAGLDLGRYLLMVDPGDRDKREAAAMFEAAAARAPTVDALLGLANAGREEDESRRALERALAIASTPRDRARVLAALGDVARDQRRPALAIERWESALREDARWWPAALSLAAEEGGTGFPAAALARLEALPAEVRALAPVARQRARLLLALDRRREAEGTWRALLDEAKDNVDLLRDLAGAARARGEVAASTELMARAAQLRPDMPSLTIEWARGLEGARQGPEARRVLEEATRRLPDEPSLAAELGRMLDRAGDAAGSADWLRRSLTLRPQDPELRRYTESVVARAAARGPGRDAAAAAEARGDLARRFAAPVPPLLAAEAARARTAARGGKKTAAAADPDPAVVLLDRRVVRVHQNGLSEVFSQRVVQVRTDAGARDNQDFLVRYTPGTEEVEILEARIFRPDGAGGVEILQAPERDDQDLSEPWYGLYYDYRAEVVRFEGLRAGDVLEVQYIVSDVSRGNQLSGYFGDLQFVAEPVPKRRWEYTLLSPRGRTFHFARPVAAGLAETVADEGDERRTQFVVNDVPRLEIEPAMPGIGEVSPYLHVSTYASWDEVGAWYWRLVEEQLAADDAVRRAVEGALREAEGAPRAGQGSGRAPRKLTVEEKVRALHALVLSGTRYVGLEFGIHGFKPYKVSQVLARKFGDCKDKAALLVTMLNQVGIDAEMVLLRTRRNGRIAPAPASLAVFDHAIAYVPALDLYLDGTAEFSGMKELPAQDQGVMVLRVGPRGSKLVETPVLPSSNNRAARAWDVRLNADGDGEVAERLTISGQAAPDWRAHYQTAGERDDRYGKVWTGRNPGARLTALSMPGLDDRNLPVAVKATATVPRLAERVADGELSLMLGARDADLVRTYARLSTRRLDLVLAYPWQHQEAVTYHLPPGFQVASLPAPRTLESRFGRFELRVDARGGGVSTEVTLDVRRDRVGPADYPEFRRFLADVDAVMAERIVIRKETSPSAAATPQRGAVR